MLFATPKLTKALHARLAELDDLRAQLGTRISTPAPWVGQLRREARTSSVESSVSIEGFTVPAGEAAGLVAGTRRPGPDDADRMAVASYARAMDHVATLAIDPHFRWLDRVVLDLHFDACAFQRDHGPGLWRTGPIFVTSADGGAPAYEGPAAEAIPELMAEVVDWLEGGDLEAHVAIRAAMAHLHLVSVHPFGDGNGRIARIVQSLVLAREGLLAPELGSTEEFLARHTPNYYAVLQAVQGGRYLPERDATEWIEFCVTAHIEQASDRVHQMNAAATRWRILEETVERQGWPDRLVVALELSLFGGVDRGSYAGEADVSLATASADLRRLFDAGLVRQTGRARSARYVASEALRTQIADA